MTDTPTPINVDGEPLADDDKLVAAQPINVDGVRAFNAGDDVPADHVRRGVVDAAAVKRKPHWSPNAAGEVEAGEGVDLGPADPDAGEPDELDQLDDDAGKG